MNVYNKLKTKTGRSLVGVGCPVHIINNAAKHAFDSLPIDIESIAFKIYNYFSIYTIRTESLKEFCHFVDVEYRAILKHSSTRWLSLYPVINRLLQVYPALSSYFLSLESPPAILKSFFESNLSEAYLYFVHSLSFVFDEKSRAMQNEKNSILEAQALLESLQKILKERSEQRFLSLKVKSSLQALVLQGYESEVATFKSHCFLCYQKSYDYIKLWTEQLTEFSCFEWMNLNKPIDWQDVECSIKYINSKNIEIDDTKCFDQLHNLQKYVIANTKNEEFNNQMAHAKWQQYFSTSSNIEFHSELLRICQFFFSIPSQNANVERVLLYYILKIYTKAL